MSIATFIRKPQHVEAQQVTAENMEEVRAWCDGQIRTTVEEGTTNAKYIKVRVHKPPSQRHTKAFVGDWVIRLRSGRFQIYTDLGFQKSFDTVVAAIPFTLDRRTTVEDVLEKPFDQESVELLHSIFGERHDPADLMG